MLLAVDVSVRVELLSDTWREHFDRLVELDQLVGSEAYPAHILEMYFDDAKKIAGLFINNRLEGYALVEAQDDVEYISVLVIDPRWRGYKLARQLLNAILTGSQEYELHVKADNHVALTLYRTYGFEVVACLTEFYNDKSNAILLRRGPPQYSTKYLTSGGEAG